MHQECVGVHDPKDLLSCPHHRCSKCNKNVQAAGGLLFPCQSCPLSFCEDCLPKDEKGFRILDTCDRFAQLGFDTNLLCYIHCSEKCEEYAKKEFKWEPKGTESPPAPSALDVSYAFGSEIDANIDDALVKEDVCETRLRKRTVMNYKDMDTADHSMSEPRPSKKDEDPDFSIDAAADISESEESETEPKHQAKKVAMPQDPKRYDVVFPCTDHGYLFTLAESSGGHAVFSGYRKMPNGQKGPAELSNKVRGVGDRIMAINRVDVTGYSFQEVFSLLRTTRAATSHVLVSFQEADRNLPAATQKPKYNAASLRERINLDGSVAPATQPRKDRNGRYIRPAGRGRIGMEWDDIRGVWVDRRKSFPPDHSTGKENAFPPKSVQSKQARVATTSGTTNFMATTSLKRKSDVIDLSSSDHARPTKQGPKVHKPPTAAKSALRPLAQGEYEASFPVTKHGMLLELGIVDGETAVFGYRRTPDGNMGPAEVGNLVRGAGDRIIAVNETDVSGRSYSDVVAFIRSVQPLSPNVVLRLRDSSFGGNPLAPKVSEADSNALAVAKPTSQPAEYDAVIPNTSRGLAMRLGNLDGKPVFLEYRKIPGGFKSPAEINNLVRNPGDKIVAVNGVPVTTYHGALVKIQESRNNPVTHLRFQVNSLNVDSYS